MVETIFTYNTPHLVYWDWRIAADLFLGGVGVGAFLWAVLNSLYYKDKYASISKTGAILSPILVILGLILMTTEMGHPFGMWRTITGFNVSSPLSWGGPFQGLLIGIGIVYAYLWVRPVSTSLRNLVGIIGIPVALLVGVYHGWLLSDLVGRPLWNTGLTIVITMLSFVTTGMGAVLLVRSLLAGSSRKEGEGIIPRGACNILSAALVLQVIVLLAWWAGLSSGSADAREAIAAFGARYGGLFWWVSIGLGLIIPIVLQVIDRVHRPKDHPAVFSARLVVLTSILILLGGFVFRYVFVIGGQLS